MQAALILRAKGLKCCPSHFKFSIYDQIFPSQSLKTYPETAGFPPAWQTFGHRGTLLPSLWRGCWEGQGCTLPRCLPHTCNLTAVSKQEGRGPKTHIVIAVSVWSWLKRGRLLCCCSLLVSQQQLRAPGHTPALPSTKGDGSLNKALSNFTHYLILKNILQQFSLKFLLSGYFKKVTAKLKEGKGGGVVEKRVLKPVAIDFLSVLCSVLFSE